MSEAACTPTVADIFRLVRRGVLLFRGSEPWVWVSLGVAGTALVCTMTVLTKFCADRAPNTGGSIRLRQRAVGLLYLQRNKSFVHC